MNKTNKERLKRFEKLNEEVKAAENKKNSDLRDNNWEPNPMQVIRSQIETVEILKEDFKELMGYFHAHDRWLKSHSGSSRAWRSARLARSLPEMP